MRCGGCGTENAAGRRFCADCGKPLPHLCVACGWSNEPSAKYCGGCGARLAPPFAPAAEPEAELREVVVLFADLVGYTRRLQMHDAEDVHGVLEQFLTATDRLVVEHRGHVDKHIGDCVMAIFGAPVGRADDPVRAGRAAAAIVAATAAIRWPDGTTAETHIGLAAGPVVAAATGGTDHRAYTVTGDAVNRAARLADASAPGEVLLDSALALALDGHFELMAGPALTLSGYATPVENWRLGSPVRIARAPVFVGRARELELLGREIARCRSSGTGSLVHIRGEPGIGKTRIVDEAIRLADELGVRIHRVAITDFGEGAGRDAIRALARDLRADTGDGSAAIEPAERSIILDLAGEQLDPGQRTLLDAMSEAVRKQRRSELMLRLLRDAALTDPMLIAVEDVHWARPDDLSLLAALASAVVEMPAVLVLTSRIEGDPLDTVWRASIRGAPLLTLDLAPLTRAETEEMASVMGATSAIAEAAMRLGDGNPLFVEQLVRHRYESDLRLPGTLQSVVQARVDALPPPDRRALRAAAVLGQRFHLDAVTHLTGEAAYAPTGIVGCGLARQAGDELVFAHALVRDAVLASLLRPQRRDLHRRAADWYRARDTVLHAEHLELAGEPGAAAAWLALATEEARRHEASEALTHCRRGLALQAADETRRGLSLLAAELLVELGRPQEAEPLFAQVLGEAASDPELSRAHRGRAAVARLTDRLPDAFAELDRAQAFATRTDERRELARIHHLRGNLLFPTGDVEGCLAEHQRSLDLAQALGDPLLEAAAFGGLGDGAYAAGKMRTAAGAFAATVDLARRVGLGRVEIANLPMLAITRLFDEEFAEVSGLAEQAVTAARRVGQPRAEMVAHHGAFFGAIAQLDCERARAAMDRALELARQVGARRFEAEALVFHGEIDLVQGHRDRALERVRVAIAIARETGFFYMGPCFLGLLLRVSDDRKEQEATLQEAESLLAAGSISHNHFFFRRDAIDAALMRGDADGVERQVHALEAYATREPTPWSRFFVARGRALARHARGERSTAQDDELRRLAEHAHATGNLHAARRLDAALEDR
ncbi:MAG: adenylate/guanylate cyclase domain-containing protein [Geminicoccaceae bacterium]